MAEKHSATVYPVMNCAAGTGRSSGGSHPEWVADDLPVTTPARTAFDLVRYQKRWLTLGRLDALMRAAPFTEADPETQIPVLDGNEPFAFLDMGWREVRLAVVKEDPSDEILARVREAWLRRGGAEIGKMAAITRTSAPNCWFGQNGRAA